MFHRDGPSFWELVEQALSSTDRGYDLLAPKFDFTPFRTPDDLLEQVVLQLEQQGLTPSRVLDVCCGTGAVLGHIAKLSPKELVGVDRSRGMLVQARQNLDEGGLSGPELILLQGDALAFPFDHPAMTQPFDVVTCFGAFGHILPADEPRLIEQIHQALAPGGRFVFVTADPPPPWAPAAVLAKTFNAVMHLRNALIKPEFVMYYLTFLLPRAKTLLLQAGFEVHETRGAFPWPYQRLVLVQAVVPDTDDR